MERQIAAATGQVHTTPQQVLHGGYRQHRIQQRLIRHEGSPLCAREAQSETRLGNHFRSMGFPDAA